MLGHWVPGVKKEEEDTRHDQREERQLMVCAWRLHLFLDFLITKQNKFINRIQRHFYNLWSQHVRGKKMR